MLVLGDVLGWAGGGVAEMRFGDGVNTGKKLIDSLEHEWVL